MKKEKLINLFESIFSIFVMFAVAGGAFMFILFLIAFVIGDSTGAELAEAAKKTYLPIFTKAASIATISGLLVFYISNFHSLALNSSEGKSKKDMNHVEKLNV